MEKTELLKKLQNFIQSGDLTNIELAFVLAKNEQITEQQILHPWEPLIHFLETHYLRFMNIRKLAPIQMLSNIISTTEISSISQFDQKKIKKIPNSIGLMIHLQELDLMNNHLSSLPKSIKNLENLHALHLINNNIKSLPKELKSLSSLEEIDWSFNNIETLPLKLNLPSTIKRLALSSNRLKKIPASLEQYTHLEFLNLSNNLLENAPKSLFKLQHLKKLYLKDNRLSRKEKRKISAKLPNCNIYF